jgi:hypothetical protein
VVEGFGQALSACLPSIEPQSIPLAAEHLQHSTGARKYARYKIIEYAE